MQIELDIASGLGYKSLSQRARVITESWVENEMYCPACESSAIEKLPNGTKVVDFRCPDCSESFQLKSSSRPIKNKIVDSEYFTMMNAILSNDSPNLALIHYSIYDWQVRDMILIPRQMIVPSTIEKRPPLSPSARRAGWVGCNILLDNIPLGGRIFVVSDGKIRTPYQVREEWKDLNFVEKIPTNARGWLVDVLRCIQSMNIAEFNLEQIYENFEDELARLHPQNRHIRPKIRQQLQMLRDQGVLRFLGKGIYELS